MKNKDMTYNDMKEGIVAAEWYGYKGRDIEKQIRKHTDGMSKSEMTSFYKDFYNRNDKR